MLSRQSKEKGIRDWKGVFGMVDGRSVLVVVNRNIQKLILLHPTTAKQLSIPPGQTFRCVCGRQTTYVPVGIDVSVPTDALEVSQEVVSQLHMDSFVNRIGAKLSSSKIDFGTLIGVLCNPIWDKNRGRIKSSKYLEALEKLDDTATGLGAVCVLFRMNDVNFTDLTVRGYARSTKGWTPSLLPLPDVIYDQMLSRKVEHSSKYQELHQKLSDIYGKNLFNDGFFDKLQVHAWLMQDSRLRQHVPTTVRYDKPQDLTRFVQKHVTTFLKPVHGSLGLGIVRIQRHSDGTVSYVVKRSDLPPLKGKVSIPANLVKVFRKRLGARPYLLQEGIALMTLQDRPLDIRLVMQRDGKGEWKRTKSFARLAQAGDFTSNISSGGEAMPVGDVLRELYHSEAQRNRCERLIRKVSYLVVEVLERQAGKTFGELGIDLGVDQDGNAWIIEVNSKPWKSPKTDKGRQDLVDLSFERPVLYAMRIAQQDT